MIELDPVLDLMASRLDTLSCQLGHLFAFKLEESAIRLGPRECLRPDLQVRVWWGMVVVMLHCQLLAHDNDT